MNTLRHVGVYVDQATGPFTVAGKHYPAGSFVIKTAQAARGQVLDMMEPQDHPNDFAYPGGPPRRPYDNAGWTLAYEMGVKFDRVLDGFDVANVKQIRGTELAKPMAGTLANASGAAGFLMSHEENDAVTVLNRVFKANGEVDWLRSPLQIGGKTWPAGTFFIPAASASRCFKSRRADLGVSFTGVASRPNGRDQALREAHRALRPVRRIDAVGLDALRVRAIRDSLSDRVSAGPRRRQSQEQVRRADPARRARRSAAPAARPSVDAAAAAVAAEGGPRREPSRPSIRR